MGEEYEALYLDQINWVKVKDKIWEKIIWKDQKSGTYIRLAKTDPGFKGTNTLKHDCDEFVYVLQGKQINTNNGKVWHQGMSSAFPAGTEHGPFATEEGIICIEFRYYSKK
jgi:mannose-6-phosphate isomerase-like protein (cupin superfamily)